MRLINIFTAHSELRNVLFFLRRQSVFFVYEISLEPLSGFAPNSHRRRVWSLARTSLKFKVKCQDHQGQKAAFLFLGPFGGLHAVYIW